MRGSLIGWTELILILFVLLLAVGPKKLPELARELGRAVREYRLASQGMLEDTPQVEGAADRGGDEVLREVAKELGLSTQGKTTDVIRKELLDEIRSQRKERVKTSSDDVDRK